MYNYLQIYNLGRSIELTWKDQDILLTDKKQIYIWRNYTIYLYFVSMCRDCRWNNKQDMPGRGTG